jgi:ATP/maltotriose-dependent transcriptional regulator MalT
MANPLFNTFGNNNNPLINQFNQFMQQMRGQDPNAIINQLMASGKINQDQLNNAHQRVKELDKQFENIKKNFGF